jgi:hypothetical protein
MSASTDPARCILLSQHSAGYHLQGAALPHPSVDPNPRLTFALHNIWARTHQFIQVHNGETPQFYPSANIATANQFFSQIFSDLICLNHCFFQSFTYFILFLFSQRIYSFELRATNRESSVGYSV